MRKIIFQQKGGTMKTVIVEIIFHGGTRTHRFYESSADNPEEDALERATAEFGTSASIIRLADIEKVSSPD